MERTGRPPLPSFRMARAAAGPGVATSPDVPEGPSLVILRELTQSFVGKRILKAEGNSRIDKTRLVGKPIVALRTWGKHFLIEMNGFAVRIHFLMFGSYCIDSRK